MTDSLSHPLYTKEPVEYYDKVFTSESMAIRATAEFPCKDRIIPYDIHIFILCAVIIFQSIVIVFLAISTRKLITLTREIIIATKNMVKND